jgi:hypothetical protein
MKTKTQKRPKTGRRDKRKNGPSPERVRINKSWETAMKDALKKKRPKGGWPDEKKPGDK